MSPERVIRPYRDSDLDAFTALYQATFPDKNVTRESVANIRNEPANVFLLEEASGARELIGFLYVWVILDEYEIIDIGVRADCRRQGAGAELLWFLIRKAHAEKRSIRLEVRVSNAAAISLYEKAGFLRQGHRKRYYADGEDAFLYAYFPATLT